MNNTIIPINFILKNLLPECTIEQTANKRGSIYAHQSEVIYKEYTIYRHFKIVRFGDNNFHLIQDLCCVLEKYGT